MDDVDQLLRMGMMPWVDTFRLAATSNAGIPKENMADSDWWWRSVPDEDQPFLQDSDRKKLVKKAISAALPCVVRGRAWLHCSGGAHRKVKSPSAFEDACQYMPSRNTGSSGVPTFGSSIDLAQFCLNGDGIDKYHRVLMCVAGVHPEVVSYCPWLPMVVAGCLHWMDERDSFAVAIALIREPSPLLMSRISSWKMLLAFDQLARANLSGEFAKLCKHTSVAEPVPLNSKHPLAGVVTTWLSQLKFWPLMRILDVFMLEGPHIFHRAGLVLLESWSRSISMSSGSRGRESGPAWYLPSSSARAVENPDQFMKDCSKYSVSADTIARWNAAGHGKANEAMCSSGSFLAVDETVESKAGKTFERVRIAGSSDVLINTDEWKQLWSKLPTRFRIKTLTRIFSTEEHGYSLRTLYNLCEEESPTVLLVRTTTGKAFGAFISYPWSERHRSRGYFGNGDAFVFSLNDFNVFQWVGINPADAADTAAFSDTNAGSAPPAMFLRGTDDMLAIGGGGSGHAIQLDRQLNEGSSAPSTTFGNPSLVADNIGVASADAASADADDGDAGNTTPPPEPAGRLTFTVKGVEVWCFTYGEHVSTALQQDSGIAAAATATDGGTSRSAPTSPLKRRKSVPAKSITPTSSFAEYFKMLSMSASVTLAADLGDDDGAAQPSAMRPIKSLPNLDSSWNDIASLSPDGASGSLRRVASPQLMEMADTFVSEPNMSRARQVDSTPSAPQNAACPAAADHTLVSPAASSSRRIFPKLFGGALSSPISRVKSVPAFNQKFPDQQSRGLEDTPSPLLSDPMPIPSPTRNCGYPKMTASPERPLRPGLSPHRSPPLPGSGGNRGYPKMTASPERPLRPGLSPHRSPPLPGSGGLPGSALTTTAWLEEQERRDATASPSKSLD